MFQLETTTFMWNIRKLDLNKISYEIQYFKIKLKLKYLFYFYKIIFLLNIYLGPFSLFII